MKIEGVVVSCYKQDVHLARICVASIRFWYPDVPIWLLKDRQYGDFDTREIERWWGVAVYPTTHKKLGWGLGKLELMTELPPRRLLIIDADIVFAGRVLDRLEAFNEDVVVNQEDYSSSSLERQFFTTEGIRRFDPAFTLTGYGFNTGQVVATTGRISKQELEPLIDWERRQVRHSDIFKMGEQGVTNYVVQKKFQQGDLSFRREPFMLWPGKLENVAHIHPRDFTPAGEHDVLIHWAGLRWGRQTSEMPRSDILLHFENLYYSRIPSARLKRGWRWALPHLQAIAKPSRAIRWLAGQG